jgi:hypothetical protein
MAGKKDDPSMEQLTLAKKGEQGLRCDIERRERSQERVDIEEVHDPWEGFIISFFEQQREVDRQRPEVISRYAGEKDFVNRCIIKRDDGLAVATS